MPSLIHFVQFLLVLVNVGSFIAVNRAILKKHKWWHANNEWNKVIFFVSWTLTDILLIGAMFLLKQP